jgi:translation initiation factor 2B subunit (eIF-2B alpha/beta/delta family)
MCPTVTSLLLRRAAELRADREHGGSWLARRAVETLVELAAEEAESSSELLERLVRAARELAGCRPGVGAVAGALGRVLSAAQRETHLPTDEFRRLFEEEAHGLLAGRDRASASIAIQLRERLEGAVVVTHSASATVREALLRTPPARVVCTVTEPIREGRPFSEELRAAGLDVELVEDEQAPALLATASILLVGADTIFRDGALCNKIGTRSLAETAAKSDVPTLVASEVIKLAPVVSGEASKLKVGEKALFDLTPPELITEIVTEEGAYSPDDIASLVDRTPFLREGYGLLNPIAVG